MILSIDRETFIDILTEGEGRVGGQHDAAARRGVGHGDAHYWAPPAVG